MKKFTSLLSKLTLEEKIAIIHGTALFHTGGVERLGIPPLVMSDGPNGIRQEFQEDAWIPDGNETDFVSWLPSNTCLCSTWNPKLAEEFGKVLGEEARGRGKDVILAPGINIKRTPLCGRNFEYMSEDPVLTAKMVVPLIQGIQSADVASCVKHFALNNQELDRMSVEVDVDDATLHELYLPAFHAATMEAGAYSIMGAYNRYEGDFCCESKKLLFSILRDKWGYDGVTISDWGGVHNTDKVACHGVDIEMSVTPDFDDYKMADPLLAAVKSGKIDESVIDRKVHSILLMMERLHLGDKERNRGCINTPKHQDTIQRVAEEGIILLKNDKKHLPLSKNQKRILVVGDNAKRTHSAGGGSSEVKALYDISPLLGIRMILGGDAIIDWMPGYLVDNEDYVLGEVEWQADSLSVDYTTEHGQKQYQNEILPNQEKLLHEVCKAAPLYDEVIFIGGLNHAYDVEGFDRPDMKLPYAQDRVIQSLAKQISHLTVVLINGGPVELPWKNDVHSLIQTSYCGMNGGLALARVLFGEVNPSGKLTESYPVSLADTPTEVFHSYPGDFQGTSHRYTVYREKNKVGYRYYTTDNIPVQFPFGYGLSYTTFSLTDIQQTSFPAKTEDDIIVTVTANTTNTGDMTGKETYQLYVGIPDKNQPLRQLRQFVKVELNPGETKEVSLSITPKDLMIYCTAKKDFVLPIGEYRLYLGTSVEDICYETTFHPVFLPPVSSSQLSPSLSDSCL